jgi:hypothetical protein
MINAEPSIRKLIRVRQAVVYSRASFGKNCSWLQRARAWWVPVAGKMVR